jgi:glycosyltransferase involved in cell wall biosynthesis
MLVSVVTVCRNSALTIADTIRSVKQQTYKSIEHIIIDGGSDDDTLNVIKSNQHSGPFISEKDKGIYDAMNKGISMAKGDIIGILNSDDFFYDTRVIERIVAAFEQQNCEAIYSDLIFVDPKNTSIVKRKWIAGPYNSAKFLSGWMPPHPTVYVKSEIYKKFGNFNYRLKCSADYDILLRFLYVEKVRVEYLKGITIRMRAGGQSTGSLTNRLRAHIEDYTAWRLNNITPHWYTLILKPLRKIKQFIVTNKQYV